MSAYDDYLNGLEQEDQKRNKLTQSLGEAASVNPDEFANQVKLAKAAAISLDVLPQYKEEAQQAKLFGEVGLEKLWKDAPKTSDFLSHPDNAKLSHDDTGNLSGFEQAAKTLKAWQGPKASLSSVVTGLAKSLPQGAELARQGMRQQFADLLGFDDMSADARRKYEQAQSAVGLSTPEFESSTASGIYSGGSSLIRQIPGLAASLLTRSTAPMLATAGIQTEAEAYGKYRARDASPGMAALGAAAEGGIEVATELLPMGYLLENLGKVGMGKFITGLLAREIPGEQLATLGQDAVDTAIANPDKTWADYAKERPDAAYQTLLATVTQAGVMSSAITIAQKVTDRGAQREQEAQQAGQMGELLTGMTKLAEASKLRERDVETAQGFFQSVLDEGRDSVFITPEALAQSGLAEQIAQAIPAVAEQIQTASESGHDIRLPIAELMATMAGPELAQSIIPHVAVDPGGFTPTTAQEYMQSDKAAELQAEVEKILGEKQVDDTFKASAEIVKSRIISELTATTRWDDAKNEADATIYSAYYAVRAAQIGVTPETLYDQRRVNFSDTMIEGEQFNQGGKLEDVSQAFDAAGIKNTVSEKDGVITLSQIVVQEGERRFGKGTAAMQALIDYADRTGQHIALSPSADFGGNKKRLVDFYKRFGFVENKGKNRAFTTSESMYRQADGKVLYQSALASQQEQQRRGEASMEKAIAGETVDDAMSRNGLGSIAFIGGSAKEGVAHLIARRNAEGSDGEAIARMMPEVIANGRVVAIQGEGTNGERVRISYKGHTALLSLYRFGEKKTWLLSGWDEDGAVGVNPGRAYAPSASGISPAEGASERITELNSLVVNPEELNQANETNLGKFSPEKLTVTMLQGANFTTTLHEGAHFFFENDIFLASKIMADADIHGYDTLSVGEKQILLDVSKLMDWHGIQGDITEQLRQWENMDFEEKRTYHERTAESFERYLFEGKAPSIELQPYFQRFAAWWKKVYTSMQNFLAKNPEAGKLNPEITAVFDRMLATTEQIQLAEQGRSMMPLFRTQAEAANIGMTPAEFEAYQHQDVDATNTAIQELQARGLRDMQWIHNARGRIIKQLQKESAAKRAEVQMEARAEIMSQPIYRAWAFLTGRMTADDNVTAPKAAKSDPNVLDETVDSLFVAIAKLGGIKKADVVTSWGVDPKDKPTSGLFGKPLWRVEGGLSIDGMAEALSQYGYLEQDENGKWDIRELEDKFKAELGGDTQFSNAYDYAGNQAPGKAGEEVVNPDAVQYGRLSLAALEEMGLPVELINHMVALKMVAKEGWHPDLLADKFEFSSGDDMVRRIAAVEAPKDAINGLTDQRMLERFGDLSSQEAIDRAADQAIHNEVRARMMASELNALENALGKRKTLASAAKEYAVAMIGRVKVRDLKPGQYASAEARALKGAQAASKAGDIAKAAAEQRNALINNYATRAAHDAQEEIDTALRYLKKFDSAGVRKGLDVDYTDQIDAMLERFDLRKGQSLKAIDKRATLAKWMEAQKASGVDPDISDKLIDEAYRTSYKNMTVEEMRDLVETVKHIEHLGRLKRRLLTAKDQREFAVIVAEAEASIRENGGEARDVELESPSGIVPWLEGVAAGHRKFASLLRQMDGGKDGGPLWRVLGRTMNESATAEAVMLEQATIKLAEIYKPILALKGGTTGDLKFIPAINASLTRGGRLSVALNWGNETNRSRVMDGDQWSGAQVNAVLATLSKEEWTFVQNVWDHIDSYWPQVAEKERRVSGKVPEKVKAEPFSVMLPDGSSITLSGGYYPIKYDSNRDDRAEKHDAAAVADDMKRGAFTRATTRRGHTKERVESVKRPVKKTLDVITQHISEVAHDLSWHEWLIDANRLIDAKPINNAIREHYGTEVIRTMKDMLTAVATADIVPQTKIDQAMLYLRANVSRSTMGLSLTTAFLQPFGLTQSMVRIGPKHVLRGMSRWGGDLARFQSGTEWIKEKSDFMRLRSKTFNRELHEIKGRVSHGNSQARQIYDASLFMLMQKMQMIADVPTWIGAYEKAKAENNDDETAVAFADQAVLDSQGGGQTKDMAEFQRKHPMLAMFYSYFNVTLNLAAESTAKTDFKNPMAVAGWMSDMALLMVIPALGPAILLELMRGGDDDDAEEWAKKLAKWQAGYLMGTVIGVREASGLVSGFDYAGPPVGRVIADLGSLGKQVAQGEIDENLVLASVRLMGTATGIPTVQIIRSWRGWKAWDEGDAAPTAVLLGPPPKE